MGRQRLRPWLCSHGVADDHRVGRLPDGRALWRCEACGRDFPWSRGCVFWGCYECHTCGQAQVDFVLCARCAARDPEAREA